MGGIDVVETLNMDLHEPEGIDSALRIFRLRDQYTTTDFLQDL